MKRKLISFFLMVTVCTLLLGACNDLAIDKEITAHIGRAEPTPLSTGNKVVEQISRPMFPSATASAHEKAYVVRIIDGDTFDVILEDGSEDRVRLLGVDTPETYGKNKPYEYGDITDTTCLKGWGKKATEFVRGILQEQNVILVSDTQAGERGFYGRLLAYVVADNRDIGDLLITNGYARVYVEGDSSMEEEYLKLQAEAQRRFVGLWRCAGPLQATPMKN